MRARTVVASFVAIVAAALPPATYAAAPLSYDDARHLLNRVGFGATGAEIRRFVGMSREDAAHALLADTRTSPVTAPPAWTRDTGSLSYPRGENASEMEKKQFRQEQLRKGLELRGWWLEEMLATPSPLTERMTLFWHNQFVSGQQKVKLAELMYRRNVTLRASALGNFGTLLRAVARDPAMVIYLDSAQNRKGTPNENFAREVMELFTLGEGHYGEQDIKVALQAPLTSDAFYAPEHRGVLVKSPVDLVVGTMRQFGMKPGEPVPFAVAIAGMGQNLFSPPNVKGWPGGEAWINTSTLLARKQFLDRLFRADDAAGRTSAASAPTMVEALAPTVAAPADDSEVARRLRLMRAMDRGLKSVQFDSDVWFGTLKATPDKRASAATRMLLAYVPQAQPDPLSEPLTLVRQIVLDAAYQLK